MLTSDIFSREWQEASNLSLTFSVAVNFVKSIYNNWEDFFRLNLPTTVEQLRLRYLHPLLRTSCNRVEGTKSQR